MPDNESQPERFALTDRGEAIVECGLSVRHMHELEAECTPENPCDECRQSAEIVPVADEFARAADLADMFSRRADHSAYHVVVDRENGTIAVDHCALPWELTGEIVVAHEIEPMWTVTVTIVCSSVILGSDYTIVLDGLHVPWLVGETGPRVTGFKPGPRYLVTIDLLADNVTETSVQTVGDETIVDAEVVDDDD